LPPVGAVRRHASCHKLRCVRSAPFAWHRGPADDAEQRSDRELETRVEQWLQLLPAPGVHADFSAASAFAVADEQRPSPVIEVGFAERKRFVDAQPRAPQDHNQAS
jgi:hypothetical protein